MRRPRSSVNKFSSAASDVNPDPVIGRFAPSPTGDLHFGSLVSAVGSYLEAKTANGQWLLRIEDIDPPREIAGSAQRIITDLQRLGMVPDGPVLYQSSRLEAYREAVDRLLDNGHAFSCTCSRKDLPDSGIYPGTCRNGITNDRKPCSVRLRVGDGACEFTDKIQGHFEEYPAESIGDFIIQRADGLFAYQLAVVLDDNFQGVSQVVRGADLLDSTSRQIWLQKILGFSSPDYVHLPVAISADGKKLSKRLQTDPVKSQDPAYALQLSLQFLGQSPPTGYSLGKLWDWAFKYWNRNLVPRQRTILPPPM
jgi:glutamyl-Q tRNA(Asp) synthetase